MKNIFSTLILLVITGALFAQKSPKFDLEPSKDGYNIILNLGNTSNIKSATIEGYITKAGQREQIKLTLSKEQLTNGKAFKYINAKQFSGKLDVVVIYLDGKEERYKTMALNAF